MITSTRNRAVTAVVRLHRSRGRRASGTTLIEGPHLLEEAVGRARILTVYGLPGDTAAGGLAAEGGAELVPVSEPVLGRMATTSEPQSPVAVVEIPEPSLPASGPLLVAWGVGDPGNVGTLIRSAAAFGLGFVAGPGTADVWAPKVLRSAAGAHWHTPIGSAEVLEDLGGRPLAATVVAGGEPPSVLADLPDVALLIGDEAHGLPAEAVAATAVQITIPMPGGTESLNAAVAGSILAYETGKKGR